MISNPNYEQHKDEIELLKNILFEKLTINEELPKFNVEIKVKPDCIEDPKLELQINIKLPDQYPDIAPKFEIVDVSNYLASSKIKYLAEKANELILEQLGMPMIYQIYELAQAFANEQEEYLHMETQKKAAFEEEYKRKLLESSKKEVDQSQLLEVKTFTKVTKEAFEAWFKKFYSEINKKKCKIIAEQETRQSGREYFFNMKNKPEEIDGDDEENIKEEDASDKDKENAAFFDAHAFEENLDDIDFDNDNFDDI
jgi:hypothetical protein